MLEFCAWVLSGLMPTCCVALGETLDFSVPVFISKLEGVEFITLSCEV